MNKFRSTIKIFAIAIFMFAFASMAQAQATRTWVSGVGDDVNPCSRTAPCKTWAGAISKTAACGEIDALDPGGFGTVTITKSMTLDGTGTMASILSAGTNGVNINVATTDVVTLRGISINGACTGLNGVNIFNAMPKAVNIEDCVIFRMTTGILVNTTSGTTGQLNVRNTVVRDMTTGDGLKVASTTGLMKASLVNSSFTGSANGVHAQQNSRITAVNCNISGNTGNGVLADGAGANAGVANISNSNISNNGTNGVNATNLGVIRINSNDIFGNGGNGALVSGTGEVDTYGNNRILANGTDGCPSCLPKGPA